MDRRHSWLFALCGLLLLPSLAHATTLQDWALADYVANCRSVVTGTVSALDVRDDGDMIHTYVTLEINQIVAGEAMPSQVVLQEMGGRIGTRATIVPGVPVYRVGDQVLVFLEDRPDAVQRTLGFYRGAYKLESEIDTGRTFYVQRMPVGMEFIDLREDVQAAVPMVRYERDELIQEIQTIAGTR